jgi:capsular exopolysaccharide synthesis family protein
MGSMSDIMDKLQEATPAETAGQPVAPAPPPAVDEAAASRFSTDVPSPPAGELLDSQTAKWNPSQIDPAVVAFHDRYSPVCEQFRSIRARLLNMDHGGAHRVIAVTSSVPQEGKSVTAVNLGMVLAEGGEHHVLIADADFRRSSIGRMLGLSARPGLAELLRGEESLGGLVCATPFPNLKVLPPGKMGLPGVSELLGAPSAREVLARLRASFHYVLLDTPPVNTVSDVSTLAPYCDGVILVVEMHRTPEPTVQQAARTLQANNVKILGCVLTRHNDRRSHYYDDGYSSYYYRDDRGS